MNHTSIKKISLTTLALVAALAVSARANGPVTSAAEHRIPVNPNHSMARVLLPDEVYQIDDGVSENSVGLTIGGDIIAFIRFDVIPGSETITSINCAFGTPLFPDPTLNGLAYTAALWDDPNGDTNPSDATLLATKDGVISQAGTDTFLLNAITPTTITTPDFFVGYVVRGTVAGQFPCGLDQTNPKNNQNWVAGGANGDIQNLENNDLPPLLLEDAGLPGNWLIRADAGGGGGLLYSSAFSEKGPWDIDLPLDGSGVEDRSGGTNKGYALYFVFNNALASVASATTTCGSVASVGVDPDVANQAEVDLTGVGCNESEITVTADGIVDVDGNTLASASITFGLLVGDVNGDRVVDHGDYHLVKGFLGQRDNSTNFRADVAISGSGRGVINAADARLVKGQQGTSLP